MLKQLSEVLTPDEEIGAAIRFPGLVALDPDSGAFLKMTGGRGRGGLPTFILILPNKSIAERGGLLTAYEWDYPKGRKILRAWTAAEAMNLANKHLPRMIQFPANATRNSSASPSH